MFSLRKALATGAVAATIFACSTLPAMADSSTKPLYGPNDTFTSCATGGDPTPGRFGHVRIQLSNTQVLVKVVVRKGVANTTYDLWLNQNPGDCPTTPTGSLKTDNKGNGWAWVLENRVPGATAFWVSATGGGQVLRSPAFHAGFGEDGDD